MAQPLLKPQQQSRRDQIVAHIDALMAEHGHDSKAAREAFEAQVRAGHDIREAVMSGVEQMALDRAWSAYTHTLRQVSKESAQAAGNLRVVAENGAATRNDTAPSSVMNLPLSYPGSRNKLIRFATRAELLAEVQYHDSRRRHAAQMGRFFNALVERMPDDAVTLGEVLGEDDAASLYSRATAD